MKRRILFLSIGLITALLLLAGDWSPALAVDCSELEQPFSIPEAFPLDGGDWVITNEANGGLVEDSVDEDGFSTATSSGLNNAVIFDLTTDVPMTITHVEADVLDSVNDGFLLAIQACYDEDCVTFDDIILQTGDTPYSVSSDDTFTDVVTLRIGLAAEGVGGVSLDNLIVEGTLGACLFRPVLTGDVVNEQSSGNVYQINTTDGARVYAIDDALVTTVIHDTNGYALTLFVNGVDSVIYQGLGSVFADVGDFVDGGCVLGYATEQGPGALSGQSIFGYAHDPDLGDWHDYAESLSVTPCNQPDSNCINPNPNFDNDAVGWSSRYAIADSLNDGDDSVMLVPKNGEIYQPGFQVATEETWFITVVVGLKAPATAGSVTVVFAGNTVTLPFSVFGGEYVTLTTTGLSPAFDGTSEFRVDNNFGGNTTLKVTFACLHQDAALIAPPRCYFEDNGLINDTFETESGATHGTGLLGTGNYTLPAGGIIRAPVTLAAFSDADTDFTLEIQASGVDGELTASVVDSDTDDELAAIGEYTFPALFPVRRLNTFTVGDGETLIGDVYIENTGSETVIVESVCLTSDAGVWPGYDNADYGNNELLPASCEECAFPESLVDVVAWLNWIGCVLRYLIFCLLYTLVNNIWATILSIVSGIGLFGRWLGKSITIVAVWLWQAVGRLMASLLGNIIPVLNAILAWILSLPFVRDVLDAAAIAAMWIDGVIQFVVGVINLFVAAVRFVGVLLSIPAQIWVAFIEGLSTASAISVPLPDCYNSGSTFYDICLVFDVLNFIVAQAYAGVAVTALFSAVAISILWHAGRSIKDDIERVFES